MLVRKEQMRASKVMQHRVTNTPNIDLKYNTEIDEVLGQEVVEGLRMRNNTHRNYRGNTYYGIIHCYWTQT